MVGVLNVNEELACPFNLFIRARCYRSFSAARVSIPVMIWLLLRSRVSTFETRRSLALENLALRQQLAVLQRSVKRSRLSNLDRGLWVLLRRFWTDWAKVFVIVKPDTVVRWHRAGFRRYWAVEESATAARSPMRCPGDSRADPQHVLGQPTLGSAARVHGELAKLGISIPQAAVSKYMIRHPKPPSQTWRSFLDNHVEDLVPIDFFTLPTATFRILFVFIISVTIVGASSISMSRSILRQSEPRSRSSMPSRGIRRRATCCETGMESKGAYFKRRVAGLDIEQVSDGARAPRGRAPTSNGSLEAFGASVSIT